MLVYGMSRVSKMAPRLSGPVYIVQSLLCALTWDMKFHLFACADSCCAYDGKMTEISSTECGMSVRKAALLL